MLYDSTLVEELLLRSLTLGEMLLWSQNQNQKTFNPSHFVKYFDGISSKEYKDLAETYYLNCSNVWRVNSLVCGLHCHGEIFCLCDN